MKRFIRILALGLLCGIGLTAARSMLHLSRGVVWVALTVLFLGIFAVNYLYIRHYNNKIRAILPLLEQNQTRAFITALEDLRERVRGNYLKNLVDMDLAIGYLQERRFDEAIGLMEALFAQNLKGVWNIVLRLNLCFSYFRAGRYREGMELYEDSRAIFDRAQGNSGYQGTLALVETFVAITEGRFQDAQTQLDEARATWNTPRSQANYYYLQTLLEQQYQD